MDRRVLFIAAGAIIFILFFTIFGERGLLRIYHLNCELQEVNSRIEELKAENNQLRRELDALRSDRRYLESIARRDFGMVRSNEIIYQFPGPQGQLSSSRPPTGGQQQPVAGSSAPAPTLRKP